MGIRFKTDGDKFVVTANLKRRGWEEVTSVLDDDWCAAWGFIILNYASTVTLPVRRDLLVPYLPCCISVGPPCGHAPPSQPMQHTHSQRIAFPLVASLNRFPPSDLLTQEHCPSCRG